MKKIEEYIKVAKEIVAERSHDVDLYIDRMSYLKQLRESSFGQYMFSHAETGIKSYEELEYAVSGFPGIEISWDREWSWFNEECDDPLAFTINITNTNNYYEGNSKYIKFDIDNDIKNLATCSMQRAIENLDKANERLAKIERRAAESDYITKEDVLDWLDTYKEKEPVYDDMFKEAGIEYGILEDSAFGILLKEKVYTNGSAFIKANDLTIRKATGNWIEIKTMTVDEWNTMSF
jgi:hypothetical protein